MAFEKSQKPAPAANQPIRVKVFIFSGKIYFTINE
jgi:hypothetical protein